MSGKTKVKIAEFFKRLLLKFRRMYNSGKLSSVSPLLQIFGLHASHTAFCIAVPLALYAKNSALRKYVSKQVNDSLPITKTWKVAPSPENVTTGCPKAEKQNVTEDGKSELKIVPNCDCHCKY